MTQFMISLPEHIFLKVLSKQKLTLPKEYFEWLSKWLLILDKRIETGDVASSQCFQAIYSEILVNGKTIHDWLNIFNTYLTSETGEPIAYSETYGKRTYRFENQWKQSPVHAIYNRFWVDALLNNGKKVKEYGELIKQHIQSNGWIYNMEVSPTNLRTRMKSEYLMSFAMGIHILKESGLLSDKLQTQFLANLTSLPPTGFLSAEYFRVISLELLDHTNLVPNGLNEVIHACEAGSGYCDFAVINKVDDYMGTAKRTSRDKSIHSPFATAQAAYLAHYIGEPIKDEIQARVSDFAKHLTSRPFDIPHFVIRDLPIPFGSDVTPVELICATLLRNKYA